MIEEGEAGYEDVGDRFDIREKPFLELVREPVKHVACNRLLLQGRGLDAQGLVADGQELPSIIRVGNTVIIVDLHRHLEREIERED